MIIEAKERQIIALAVARLSPSISQVNIPNTMLPTPNPTSLVVHSWPVSSIIELIAYQKTIDIGKAKTAHVIIGRSSNQPQTNCELNWNQARTFAMTNSIMPFNMLVSQYRIRALVQFSVHLIS
tara:strand:- start:3 stop:374 length:372 start_codon:yes stop_codon:yes gene_type:complete